MKPLAHLYTHACPSICACLLILLLALFLKPLHAQEAAQLAQATSVEAPQVPSIAVPYPYTISGQVIDHEGMPLAFAIVVIYEGDLIRFGTQADEDGKFRLTIEWDQEELGELEMVARYMGDQTERIRLKANAIENLLIEFPEPPKIDCICTPFISHYPLEYRGSGMRIAPAYRYVNWEFEQW